MSARTRVLTAAVSGIAVAAGWAAFRPDRARAQAPQVPPVPVHYEVSVIPAPAEQPRWLIVDTQTGTMELWQRDAGAFQVTRYQFGGPIGTTRRVADPKVER